MFERTKWADGALEYITNRFQRGPNANGAHAVTGEAFVELVGIDDSPIAAWRKFWEEFDNYAKGKGTQHKVYFRIAPECQVSFDGEQTQVYSRLLISDKDHV